MATYSYRTGSGSSISSPIRKTTIATSSLKQEEAAELERKLTPESSTVLVEGGRYLLPDDGVYANEATIVDAITNATAVNQDRYPERLALFQFYTDGHPVTVTYFHTLLGDAIDKTMPVDIDGNLHVSHRNYQQINNFVLYFDKPLDYEYSPEDGSSKYSSTAVTVPGFKPMMGDFFYLASVVDGTYVMLAVRHFERLTISTGTHYRIHFDLHTYLTPEVHDRNRKMVTNVCYFDEVVYFNGAFTLLTHDSYILRKELTQLRKEMSQRYMSTYWDDSIGSIWNPKGYFDPYLVNYLQLVLSIDDTGKRPRQLYARLYDFEDSIWYAITKGSNTDLSTIKSAFRYRAFNPHFWSADTTSLAQHYFIQLGAFGRPNIDFNLMDYSEDPKPDIVSAYPYGGRSKAFWSSVVSELDMFENLLLATIKRRVEAKPIWEVVKHYHTWTKEKGFYDIPFAISMIDHALFNLSKPLAPERGTYG